MKQGDFYIKAWILIVFSMFVIGSLLIGVTAADYKFQNATGTNLTIIHGDTGNLTVTGNISANTGFFNLAWSYITDIPNLLYGIWTVNNVDNLLISNGTLIGYNQTIFSSLLIRE